MRFEGEKTLLLLMLLLLFKHLGAVCFPAKGRKIVSRKTSFPFSAVCFAAKQLAKYNSHFPLAVATVKFVVM